MFQHYLVFGGDCEEALETYGKAFGGKVTELCRYGDIEGLAKLESQKRLVLHSTLTVGSGNIMCADSLEATKCGDNMFVIPKFATVAEVKKAWNVLKDGGLVTEDLCEPFYAKIYGCVRDKYGINWMLMIEKKK